MRCDALRCVGLVMMGATHLSYLIVELPLWPDWPAELFVAKVRWWFDWDLRCLMAVMLL